MMAPPRRSTQFAQQLMAVIMVVSILAVPSIVSGARLYPDYLQQETPGILVTPIAGLVTSEAGETATFTVVLTTQPAANVTIHLSSSDESEGTISPSTLTFTAENWMTPQTVTVIGQDDAVDDGDIGYTMTLSPSSTDPAYNGLSPQQVSLTNLDDDTAGITVTPSGTQTTESGGSVTIGVQLTSQPLSDVVIAASSSNTNEGLVTPASLMFSSSNWSTAQYFTITGQNDAVDDGDIAYTVTLTPSSDDQVYNALSPQQVSLTNLDDDTAGITVTPSGTQTTESGGSVTIGVQFTSQPLSDVVIAASSSNTNEGLVTPASLMFSSSNWSTAQYFTITGQNDAVDDGDIAYTVALSPSSDDPVYNALSPQQVSLTNLDDDTAGITVTPTSGLTTSESGGTAQFTVRLNSQPTANVVFNLSSDNTREGAISPSTLTFTAENWMTPQTVTVTGQDDSPPVVDGPATYHIIIPAPVTEDELYATIDPPDVTVVNSDNDTPGIIVNPASGLVTTEKGGKATFTVTINTVPSELVYLGLSSSDSSEGGLDKGYLGFDQTNWSTPQAVTVAGVNDMEDDGDQSYSIIIEVLSGDKSYLELPDTIVDVTNLDDDGPVVIVGDASVTEPESGTIMMDFPVSLAESPDEIVITYSTEDDTASAGSDYLPAINGKLTIPAWTSSSQIPITILGDTIYEGKETFKLNLSVDPDKATLAASSVEGNLDESKPVLQFGSSSYLISEMDGSVKITLTLSKPLKEGLEVKVNYTTEEGTAKAPADFSAINGNLIFNSNETQKIIQVPIVNDDINDPGETFQVKVDDITGPAQMAADPLYTTITILEGRHWVFLPGILNRPRPDLVGTISIEPVKSQYTTSDQVLIKATITNQGTQSSGDFYVDVYFNPKTPPTGPNFDDKLWCASSSYCYWISWEVPHLDVGESITLVSNDTYIFDKWWPGKFEHAGEYYLYLLVDSWSEEATSYGQVEESNEANNISLLTTTVK